MLFFKLSRHRYPCLAMDWPWFLSIWPGNLLHSALFQGSGNSLLSPCFRLRGCLDHPLCFFLSPSLVLCKSSLVNSPGLLSLVCHLFVSWNLDVQGDVFEGLLSTVIIHFYSSKSILPICSLLLLQRILNTRTLS